MNWVGKYVGIPFKSQGRDEQGCDCWGLVRLVYTKELQITLPSYGEISATDLASVADNISQSYALEPWVEVVRKDVRPFDVAVMKFHGSRHIGHVGVIVDSKNLIHTEKNFDAAIVPLDHLTLRHRLVSYRRHRSRILTNG